MPTPLRQLPRMLRIIFAVSLVVLACGGALLLWSSNSAESWISIGVAAMLVLLVGSVLLVWALVWGAATILHARRRRD